MYVSSFDSIIVEGFPILLLLKKISHIKNIDICIYVKNHEIL